MSVADAIPKAGVILDRDSYEEWLDPGMINLHVISKC